MSDSATSKSGSNTQKAQTYMTTYALVMMNVAILAGLGNDVQQAFYGLSSVTLFAIGAIIFFIPTALVAAELAGGWTGRGGIFRWVGEGMGKGFGFTCLLILWFQTSFNLGSGMPSGAATIGFFTTDYDWAVKFAENPKYELPIMCVFLAVFWLASWLCTKGVKIFANVSKWGVTFGTIVPLATIIILIFVWIAQGHKSAIEYTPSALIPKWNGMSTLALAAGVFFSYAGIDENAAYIKKLKNPRRQFPIAMLAAGIIAFIIFVVGTVIIATVIPEKDINVIYALNTLFHELGATIGMPWLYMLFVYVGILATIASWVTNIAGPSFMLGQAARSGFLPKKLQSNNKHGMPSRMIYLQAFFVTVIAFIVKVLPNVEGFVVMISQTITVLYMFYYVLMFVSFLRLRYMQPNRPRTFKIPGGYFGAWLVAGVGIASSVFGIVLSIYPPAQIKKEVGSGTVYVVTIIILVAVILGIAFGLYMLSKRHDWVDKDNKFAPFTWEIEGFKTPRKALSNIPTDILTADQNPMGMPIKVPFNPNETLAEYDKRMGNVTVVNATASVPSSTSSVSTSSTTTSNSVNATATSKPPTTKSDSPSSDKSDQQTTASAPKPTESKPSVKKSDTPSSDKSNQQTTASAPKSTTSEASVTKNDTSNSNTSGQETKGSQSTSVDNKSKDVTSKQTTTTQKSTESNDNDLQSETVTTTTTTTTTTVDEKEFEDTNKK